MKYILFTLMLIMSSASGQSIQEELRATPEMSEKCIQNISYFQDKIGDSELKVHLSTGQKIKVHYYKSELKSWQDYCYGDADDPDFQ